MTDWATLVEGIQHPQGDVTIHVVGKYIGLEDSYKSLHEALVHGGFKHGVKVNVKWIEAEALEQDGGDSLLDGAHGILVPGGFGDRGTRGMMRAAHVARTKQVPFFGICYGFQWATVEFARNVCGLADADSTECAPDTPTKVIYKLRDLLGVDDLGGTMRLGAYACQLEPGSLSQRLYGADVIHERHRHRYEFNCLYEQTLTEQGPADRRPIARRQVRRDRRAARPTRGSWRCSSTPSSRASRARRTRSSRASSRRPSSTSTAARPADAREATRRDRGQSAREHRPGRRSAR